MVRCQLELDVQDLGQVSQLMPHTYHLHTPRDPKVQPWHWHQKQCNKEECSPSAPLTPAACVGTTYPLFQVPQSSLEPTLDLAAQRRLRS